VRPAGSERAFLALVDRHHASLTRVARLWLDDPLADAAKHLPRGATALSAFCSAMTVAWLHGGDHFDELGYRQERAWQSAFIAQDLTLDRIGGARARSR
jgi:hypothetical protein